MSKLGVNIDHVATLRQARGGDLPDPLLAARICEEAGADGIVAHLREDRRHIQDRDLPALKKQVRRLNLEMSLNKEILAIALRLRPAQCTLVPERRQELTTEGGLDVIRYQRRVRQAAEQLGKKGIAVSLFVDPDQRQILACAQSGAPLIELHTGRYADARSVAAQQRELVKLQRMTAYAQSLGLVVNAGHGLNYQNTRAVARIPGIEELNIGHAIIARAILVGLAQAVREMLALAGSPG